MVLVPNRELAEQVLEVFKLFKYEVPMKYFALFSGQKYKIERDKLKDGVDVLVTTPDRLQKHRERERLFFSSLLTVVVDEIDTLLDAGYGKEIKLLIEQVLGTKGGSKGEGPDSQPERLRNKQFVFVGATITRGMETMVKEYFDGDK